MQQTICDLCKRPITDGHVILSVVHPPDSTISFDYHSDNKLPCWEIVSAAITSAKPPVVKN